MSAPRRVKVETTDVRWFDVDEEMLRAYYGDEIPYDLGERISQQLYDGDGFPGWLDERHDERDMYPTINVYGMCPEHDRIMDSTQYGNKEPGCGTCWLDGYYAAHPEKRAAARVVVPPHDSEAAK